jgi:hypothetical protein
LSRLVPPGRQDVRSTTVGAGVEGPLKPSNLLVPATVSGDTASPGVTTPSPLLDFDLPIVAKKSRLTQRLQTMLKKDRQLKSERKPALLEQLPAKGEPAAATTAKSKDSRGLVADTLPAGTINAKMASPNSFAYVFLAENDVPLDTLIDSGAGRTLISAARAKACGLTQRASDRELAIEMADGRTDVIPLVTATLRLADPKARHKPGLCIEAAIVPKLGSYDVLLGFDFLKKYEVKPSWTAGFIDVHHGITFAPDGTMSSFKSVQRISGLRRRKPTEDSVNIDVVSAATMKRIISKAERTPEDDPSRTVLYVGEVKLLPQARAEAATAFNTLVEQSSGRYKRLLLKHRAEFEPPVSNDAESSGLPAVKLELRDDAELPAHMRQSRMTPEMSRELDRQIQALIERGFVQPSEAAIGAPVIFAKKREANGGWSWRLCIDHRILPNSLLKRFFSGLPRQDELIQHLSGAKFFWSSDLHSSFHQLALHEESRYLTAFQGPGGRLYEWKTLPMGLATSPGQLQNAMHHVLGGPDSFLNRSGHGCAAYADDVIAWAETEDQMCEVLEWLLGRFRKFKLKLNPKKTTSISRKIHFLGRVISEGKIENDPEKVESLATRAPPTNIREVREFLGFCGFFRDSVENFSLLARPLNDLLRGNPTKLQPVELDANQLKSFNLLRKALMKRPVLAMPRYDRRMIIAHDASRYCVGSAILQEDDLGKLHPLVFFSKRLDSHQVNYPVREKEMLGLLLTLERFEPLLKAAPEILCLTDHTSLTTIFTQHVLTGRLYNWLAKFQSWPLTFRHVPGKQHVVADYMSRPLFGDPDEVEPQRLFSPDELFETADNKEIKFRLAHALLHDRVYAVQEIVSRQLPLRNSIMEAQRADPFLNAWIENCKQNDPPLAGFFFLQSDGLLCVRDSSAIRVPLPMDNKVLTAVLSELHYEPTSGHTGYRHLARLFGRRFMIVLNDDQRCNLRELATEFVATCARCQLYTPDFRSEPPVKIVDEPLAPGLHLSFDYITDLPPTELKGDTYDAVLTLVDRFSRARLYVAAKKTDTAKITYERVREALALRGWGTPLQVQIDQGPNLAGAQFSEVFQLLGAKVLAGTPYRDDNSLAEAANRLLTAAMRFHLTPDMRNWASVLPLLMTRINDIESVDLHASPNEIASGQSARLPIDNGLFRPEDVPAAVRHELANRHPLWERHQLRLLRHNRRLEARLNVDVESHDFAIGQKVLVNTKYYRSDLLQALRPKDKWRKIWTGPFEIVAKSDEAHYTIRIPTKTGDRLSSLHATCFKLWRESDAVQFPGRVDEDHTAPAHWPSGIFVDRILLEKRLGDQVVYETQLSNGLRDDRRVELRMFLRGKELPPKLLAAWASDPRRVPA